MLNYYNKMYTYDKIYICEYCDYKTLRFYNLSRHMIIKHEEMDGIKCSTKENPNAPKENPNAPKENPNAPKENPNAPKENPNAPKENPHIYRCNKCEKNLSRHSILIKHKEKCKGKINPLECIYCKEIFTIATARYRHQKKCKSNLKIEASPVPVQTQLIQNIQTQNVQNIQTQNNINIIVYNSDSKGPGYQKDQGFIIDDGMKEKFIEIVNKYYPDCNEITKQFNRLILSKPENQLVRKTNLRSSHSMVHVGNNNWKHDLDKEVYPHVVSSLSNSMIGYIDKNKFKKYIYNNVKTHAQYISDGGYNENSSDSEEQKELSTEYRKVEYDCKTAVYNYTTDTK